MSSLSIIDGYTRSFGWKLYFTYTCRKQCVIKNVCSSM